MINNSININKANNHISPKLIEHKNDHDLYLWKSRKIHVPLTWSVCSYDLLSLQYVSRHCITFQPAL